MTELKPRLRIAGECECGRKLNRYAPKGRATAEVKCPKDGCGRTVKLSKVPDAAVARPLGA